ncbi:hypothetical protein THAOC_13856, partial [Thalassiosira oceanica]
LGGMGTRDGSQGPVVSGVPPPDVPPREERSAPEHEHRGDERRLIRRGSFAGHRHRVTETPKVASSGANLF